MSFRNYLNEQLQSNTDKEYLLIGEDHRNSSALIGLAHNNDLLRRSDKRILVLTEDLPRKMKYRLISHVANGVGGFFKNMLKPGSAKTNLVFDTPYTIKDINKRMKEKDPDREALIALIKSGAKVYGVESPVTAPSQYLTSKNKTDLYKEIQKKLPYLFNDPQAKESIDRAYEMSALSFEDFKFVIASRYAASDQRIIFPNREFSKQMQKISNRSKKKTLCIFTGGAAHIPTAQNEITHSLVDEGMLLKLQNQGCSVKACFLNDRDSQNNETTYRPRNDGVCLYGLIMRRFKILSRFSLATDYQEHLPKVNAYDGEVAWQDNALWNQKSIWQDNPQWEKNPANDPQSEGVDTTERRKSG